MNEIQPDSETIFPRGSFAETLVNLDRLDVRSALRPVYPAVDLPGNAIMIGDPKEALASCPRAFHVTNTSVLSNPIDIWPLSHHQMNFERVTGKVMVAVLDAFNATKFTERSVNDPYPIPASSEVNGAVFLGNNVSNELLRMSREATIIRPESAKEISLALTLLAWQTRSNMPPSQHKELPSLGLTPETDKQLDLTEYAQAILQPLSSEAIAKLIKGLPEGSFDSMECTEWALRKIGITGFWAKGIYSMIHHSDQYPDRLKPSWSTEEELVRLAQNVPEYIGENPPDQLRVPIIIEADPAKTVPTLEVGGKKIPYVFYSQTRPDSILTVPHLDEKSITKMWIDPQDLDLFTEYLWLRKIDRLSSTGTQITRPRKTYEGKQPLVEYVDYNQPNVTIPIFIKDDQDIPTTDFCINRYPDEVSMYDHFMHELEQGNRLFITNDRLNNRLEAIQTYGDAIGRQLKPHQKKLVQGGVIRYK